MISHLPKSSVARFSAGLLSVLLLLGGAPLEALQQHVVLVPRESPPEWLAPWLEASWLEADTWQGPWDRAAGSAASSRQGIWRASTSFAGAVGSTGAASHTIAPEIVALARSFDNSPAAIYAAVYDQVDFDPKWGADSPPLVTRWEKTGTSWDQAWLLQELLVAAGVDARLEWGEVEVSSELLT